MSEIKVNKISPKQTCTQVTLGDSGDTFTIPAGVTLTNNGTATGFGATYNGAVNWDTTVKTAGFTAVSGTGYFVNTTGGAITVTLPSSPSVGDIVSIADYAGTAETNNITIARNGSNINGAASDLEISKNNSSITLVYVDGTQGWKATVTSNLSDIEITPAFVIATGGTITCDGDYKIHTFTGPGTFTVCSVGNPAGSDTVDYLVVAGGAGGGSDRGGGGGAGGYRTNYTSPATTGAPVTATSYPITVGAGGSNGTYGASIGGSGGNSIFSTITSTGGGGGGSGGTAPVAFGNNGGSGGGGSNTSPRAGGSGNTPPVSPPQGNNGGTGTPTNNSGGGGGGASSAGTNASTGGGPGGNGSSNLISGSSVTYSGGGGGSSGGPSAGSGGPGGGGAGSATDQAIKATAGTTNTGGGGGGGTGGDNCTGANGGSGIVIIRYKFQ
jgi:hypothetical protein